MGILISDYLKIRYGEKDVWENSKLKVELTPSILFKARLSDIKINNVAISEYNKTLNSATIMYRVSVGYNTNNNRKEELYEVEYTLRLNDEYGALMFLECKTCGAPLKESNGICPYCGTKHMRDTISNWVVTNIIKK